MRRIRQAIRVTADNFIRRGCVDDNYAIQPILDRLAGAEQLNNAGPGLQNLLVAIQNSRSAGTIGDYVGIAYATDDSYLNRGSPLYTLRQAWWTEIFNLGMRSNPAGGMMHLLDTLEEMTMILGILLRQMAFCSRVYNFEFRSANARMSIVSIAHDVINVYEGSTAPVTITVPARAVAINCLTGISALRDMIQSHVIERPAFLRSQITWHGIGADVKAAAPFWDEFEQHKQQALEWFGMGRSFRDISFNVLGVEREEPAETRRKNHNLQCWRRWADEIAGGQYDVLYEFDDGREPPENEKECPFGMKDPRSRSSSTGLYDLHLIDGSKQP